jgi:TonB family protein
VKSCTLCGERYPDIEKFCKADGAALVEADMPSTRLPTDRGDEKNYAEQSLECQVCGGKALPGETRCNYCGARLQAESAESAQPSPSIRGGDSESLAPARSASGPREFGYASVDDPEPERPGGGRRLATILGFSSAAVVALAAGVWFALYLGKPHPPAEAPATPSAATSPLTVELAKGMPLRIQSDVAGMPSRDPNSILKVFEDNKAGLTNVYGNALGSDPSMRDGMVVRLHIVPNGSVDNGAVEVSTSGNPSFDAEVVEAMTSWKFAAVGGSGVTADYPVIFAPSPSATTAIESDLNNKLASLSPNEPPEYAFSPSGGTPTAVAEGSTPAMPSAMASAGTSTAPGGTSVAGGTLAPAPEPTTLAALPPTESVAAPEATPAEMTPVRPRGRRQHRARREMAAPPPEIAALPPPKPSLIERVNGELRTDRRLRRVQAYTNGSVVTIFGKVFDDNDRLLAERTVRNTDGVSTVINNLTTDTQQWDQNQRLITQALQNAGLNGVQVKVIGPNAYLSGQVKTDLDRERAVTVAQAAAPVRVRENLITVAIGNMLGF